MEGKGEKEEFSAVPLASSSYKPPFVTVELKNVSFRLHSKKEKSPADFLLQNVSGYIQSGELVGVFGDEMSGKSSLLNVLAARSSTNAIMTGQVILNGKTRNFYKWNRVCSFIEKDNRNFPNLTPEEVFSFAAPLRMSSALKASEKAQIMEDTITDLGLENCRKMRVGNIDEGERRRVRLGIELISESPIILMDGQTRGLNDHQAFELVQKMRGLTRSKGKAIVMSMDQPRTEVLNMFDKIIILSQGKVIWFGTVDGALKHFESIGYSLPPQTNTSTYFFDLSMVKKDEKERHEKLVEAWKKREDEAQFKGTAPHDVIPEKFFDMPKSSFLSEFGNILGRGTKNVVREKSVVARIIAQALFLVIIIGFIYFRLDHSASGLRNRLGITFFIAVNLTIGYAPAHIGIFMLHREIILKERASRPVPYYWPYVAYFANVLSTIPVLILGALTFSIPVYWMIGLYPSASRYFTFIFIVIIQCLSANSIGILVASASSTVPQATALTMLFIPVLMIFSGIMLDLKTTTWVFRWIKYISSMGYTNNALSLNEFPGQVFACINLDPKCTITGEEVLVQYRLDDLWLWHNVLCNFCVGLGFILVGCILFEYTSRPRQQFKRIEESPEATEAPKAEP